MSASAPFFTASWRAGPFLCELSVPPLERGKVASALIEWSPHLPRQPLSRTERREYERGRDAAMAQLHEKMGIGGTAAVLDL